MAPNKRSLMYRLVSSVGTGFFYIGKKSTKQITTKRTARKFDPMVNQYVLFNEVKMPSGKKHQKKK